MVDWAYYLDTFATAEDAQPMLNEAAKQIGAVVYAANIGVEVDGENLVFVDNGTTPPSKIIIAVTPDQLQSGEWHREFSVRALDAALAVFIPRA
jgi:hypothetical protein